MIISGAGTLLDEIAIVAAGTRVRIVIAILNAFMPCRSITHDEKSEKSCAKLAHCSSKQLMSIREAEVVPRPNIWSFL